MSILSKIFGRNEPKKQESAPNLDMVELRNIIPPYGRWIAQFSLIHDSVITYKRPNNEVWNYYGRDKYIYSKKSGYIILNLTLFDSIIENYYISDIGIFNNKSELSISYDYLISCVGNNKKYTKIVNNEKVKFHSNNVSSYLE